MKSRVVAVVCILASCSVSSAQEPRWEPGVVATGARRDQLESTPLLHRPYRPLHLYGNTLRRMHYRGRAIPQLQDVRASFRKLLGR